MAGTSKQIQLIKEAFPELFFAFYTYSKPLKQQFILYITEKVRTFGMAGTAKQIELVKATFPNIDYLKFEDIDRAVNWELWHGPLQEEWNYWNEVEPLEHYKFTTFDQACKDLVEILSDLPAEIWIDEDADCILTSDPSEDEANWIIDPDGEVCDHYIGPDNITVADPRQILMFKESYSQVF